jgi:hypothetical protein
LFENRNFLPLGLAFTHFIPESIFLQMPQEEKTLALLSAVVLSAEESDRAQGVVRWGADELRAAAATTGLHGVIAERRAAAFDMRFFSQNRIQGSIQLDEKAVLVFQTPFDRGWKAQVNGMPARLLKADVGLLGLSLREGKNLVELRYRPPYFALGLTLTLISCCIMGFAAWWWPKIPLPESD